MKKLISLALCLVLILSLLSGCQKAPAETTPDTTAPAETQSPEEAKVLKILNIGNSHGVDSAWLLYDVLKAEMPEQEIVVADLYYSGALFEHVDNVKKEAAIYSYFENTSGQWKETQNTTITYGLQAQHWDYVVFNESSRHLGLDKWMTNGNLEWFIDYINEQIDYDYKLVYNMTWSNPTDEIFHTDPNRMQPPSTFKNSYMVDYGFDRVKHYNALVEKTKQYIETNEAFDHILHLATPVQYATEILKVPQADTLRIMDMYRDYTHLSDFARLMVAYMWYAELFGIEEITDVKIDVIPARMRATAREKGMGDLEMTKEHKDIIIESVNHALKNPLSIPEA